MRILLIEDDDMIGKTPQGLTGAAFAVKRASMKPLDDVAQIVAE